MYMYMYYCNILPVQIDLILTKYDWIPTEQQYFGQPNTAYDFTAHDPRQAQNKISKLQEQKVYLTVHVNNNTINLNYM